MKPKDLVEEYLKEHHPAYDEELGVELASGLNVRSLQDGTTFEVKPNESQSDYDNYPQNYENFPEEELLKYSKSQLLAVDSDEEVDVANMTPFEKLSDEMVDISTDQDKSVLKLMLRPGIGGNLPENALITIHYNAYLDSTAEPFDSTYIRNKPQVCRLGAGDLLPGLEIGVKSMKEREKSQFLVAPEWAYGQLGCLNRIPPNATILFEVELVGSLDNAAMVEFNKRTCEEQSAATFQELMKVARAQHATGNDLEKKGMREKALPVYLRATRLLENATYANADEETEGKGILLKLYLNITRLAYVMNHYRRSCKYGDEALKIDPNSSKALYWLGCSCIKLNNWERAIKNLKKARRIEPNSEEINQALVLLDKKKNESDEKERRFCRRMFPGIIKPVAKAVIPIKDNEILETIEEAIKDLHLSESREPLVLNRLTEEEFACVEAVAKDYEDIEIIKCESTVKICKKD